MYTKTSYGTWANHGDSFNVSVEATILDAINGGDGDWQKRMENTGALGRVASDYRDAINEALPEGVSLAGDDFYGPWYEADYTWDGELDIAAIVKGIDLTAIIKRHDVGKA